jgi:predicted nucleic acid-binding protein
VSETRAWITWIVWLTRDPADSDVLIEHLRGNAAARDWLVNARQASGPLAISVVSLTEIAGGIRSPERREVLRLLGSMQRFEVTEQVAWRHNLCGSTVAPIPGSALATT